MQNTALLHFLQLVSPALPVGAYSYSEGLETLVQQGTIADAAALQTWLTQELRFGAIRLETAALVRSSLALQSDRSAEVAYWNQWLSAFRDTEELQQQSWQMGRSLAQLLQTLYPKTRSQFAAIGGEYEPCNFAIAFAIGTAVSDISPETAALGYLYSWVANLVNAGVRLIPLGQTAGQQILAQLSAEIEEAQRQVMDLDESDWFCWSWNQSIASMQHETLYSRLFRS